MNAYEVISLALHPYVLVIMPEKVFFVVMLCARYNTQNSCQHASVFCIRRRTHHEVQVLNEQAESFRIYPVSPLLILCVGLINQVNTSVTNLNHKDVDIRQQSKATTVIYIDLYPPEPCTPPPPILTYIWLATSST